MKKYIKVAAICFIAILLLMFVLNAYHADLFIKELKELLNRDFGIAWIESSKKQYNLEITVRILGAITDLILIGLIICLAFFKANRKIKITCVSLLIFLFLFTIITSSMNIDYGHTYLTKYLDIPKFT